MRRLALLFIIASLAGGLFAAHDFTINGEEEAWVTLGDTLFLQFAFENVGGVADIGVSISAAGIEIPLYESTGGVIADGVVPDETGMDGLFALHIPANFSFPTAAAIILTVTDSDVSDTAVLHFEQLDSTFYLYGSVEQEYGWVDLPVPAALVYTFYNASIEEIQGMLENFELEAFLAWITQDHYVLSEMTGLLGDYQLYIPDGIPNVNCTVGVYSMLDFNGEFAAPPNQSVTVNGACNVDFYYAEPDGYLEGEVLNEWGNIPSACMLTLTRDDNPNFFQLVTTDSLSQFSVPLVNGDYTLSAVSAYLPWEQDFTLNGGDVWVDVELLINAADWASVTFTTLGGEPTGCLLEVRWNGAEEYSLTIDLSSGAGNADLPYGQYASTLYAPGYAPVASTFEIDMANIDMVIPLPGADVDENAVELTSASLYPNPFNPTTTFSFALAQPGQAEVCVYDIRGRVVHSLHSGVLTAGEHSLVWDGRDDRGDQTGSGVYLFRLRAGDTDIVRKAVMLK